MTERTTSGEAIKRQLNDEIAVTAAALDADRLRPQLFYCECDDLTCVGRIEIPRLSFRELRRLGQPLISPDCLSAAA